MTTPSVPDAVDPLYPPPGSVEVAIQLLKHPGSGYQLRVIKRTATWFAEVDSRHRAKDALRLTDVTELLTTLSDILMSELISRQGVQLSLGGY